MEYEFIHDSITGTAHAQFSLEHQLMGPWLETEIGQDIDKLSTVLKALDDAEHQQHEIQLVGKEFTITITHEEVTVNMNIMLNGGLMMPDELASDTLSFDYTEGASCGVEDFREILRSWANFKKF